MISKIFKKTFTSLSPNLNLKKFYKKAHVEKLEKSLIKTQNFVVKLDGKQVKTPNKHVLCCNQVFS